MVLRSQVGSSSTKSKTDYDVIVVGTGPAGGMAACTLAESDLSVLVIDRAELPRMKPCGGAMPNCVRELIDWDISHLSVTEVDTQHYFYGFHEGLEIKKTPDPMLLVNRDEFDKHFIDRALELSDGRIELLLGVGLDQVVETDSGITVLTDEGEQLTSKYLIGADGASSKVARSLGLYRRPGGAAIDAAVYVSDALFESERQQVIFRLQCLPSGYGWTFPKKDHLSCGVGMWRDPKGLKSHMQGYLAECIPENEIARIEQLAHPVPVFQGHRQISTPRACLVGDAAQFVDPIVGEGIIYALESGVMAAMVCWHMLEPSGTAIERGCSRLKFPESLVRDRMQEHTSFSAYQVMVRETIARKLNYIRLTTRNYFDSPQAFYQSQVAS